MTCLPLPAAVFVDSSTLSTGLANVQTQLCLSMSPGGSLYGITYDAGILEDIVNVAYGLLCTPGSGIKLSDIPGMLDGSGSEGIMSSFRALSLLAQVSSSSPRLRLRSLGPRCTGTSLHHPSMPSVEGPSRGA